MSPIAHTFRSAREEGRLAFMPFVTAGDPDLNLTTRIVHALAKRKVDLIELGFPYSDPIADGPVIQSSYTRALANRIRLDDIFGCVAGWDTDDLPPVVAMVSFALIFRYGTERFVNRAAEAGFAGLIVPDLPADEAADLLALTDAAGLDLVQLIAPTTSDDRVANVLATARGFVYCISVAGVTGERNELPVELTEQLRDLRTRTDLPLAVGFGISSPDQVDMLRGVADGVIVGSAIVRHLEGLTNDPHDADGAVGYIEDLAEKMVRACRSAAVDG